MEHDWSAGLSSGKTTFAVLIVMAVLYKGAVNTSPIPNPDLPQAFQLERLR